MHRNEHHYTTLQGRKACKENNKKLEEEEDGALHWLSPSIIELSLSLSLVSGTNKEKWKLQKSSKGIPKEILNFPLPS